jgi:hypothetical protein
MAESEPEKDRRRSPNYPSISLREAVDKIKVLYKEDRGAATAPEIMAKHWATTVKSSSFLQTVGTLKKYGLIFEIEGLPRKMKLTKTALEIVMLPESDPRYIAAIKQAALKPKLFSDLWTQYGPDLPSEDTLAHELVSAHHFLVDAATDAIKQYKRNIEFAKLSESDKIKEVEEKEGEGGIFSPPELGLGFKKMQSPLIENPPSGTKPTPQGVKQDAFISETGEILVKWPARLAATDREDLAVWLDRVKRRILGSVESDSGSVASQGLKDDGPAKIEMFPK